MDSVNNTIAMVISLKYSGGMYTTFGTFLYMLCLYNTVVRVISLKYSGGI